MEATRCGELAEGAESLRGIMIAGDDHQLRTGPPDL
jgi:hypothetical protein